MNWIHAVRMCGGSMYESEIQMVRDKLDELGYETELDRLWIGTLRRGSNVIWQVDSRVTDGVNAARFLDALAPSHFQILNDTFGPCSIDHLEFPSEYDDGEDLPNWIAKAKPIVGAATKLPLPR